MRPFLPIPFAISLALMACGPRTVDVPDAGSMADSGVDAGPVDAGRDAGPCGGPAVVPCKSEVAAQMPLTDTGVATGGITQTVDGSGWISVVDARAAGAFVVDQTSFVYASFGDSGLTKVGLSDADSLESMDWDIAFRRATIRVNSGNSGPACVKAALMPANTVYEDVTAAPTAIPFQADDYFSQDCVLIEDGSGMGWPATALGDFYVYNTCVKMSHNVFVVRLKTGRHVKVTVIRYYDETEQTTCDSTGFGGSPMPTTSAHVAIRWAFLD